MEVKRKPHQIILIEHLFYPFIAILFLILAASYGPKVASIHTELQAKDIYEISLAIGGSFLAIATIIVLPYSCVRLWKSSNLHLNGFWRVTSKFYAVVILIAGLIYGFLMLISLPNIYSAAFSI